MKKTSLVDAFNLYGKGMISIMGAGGKTTLMFQLAKLLLKAGKKVLTTTTTKIFMPSTCESDTVILSADFNNVYKQLKTKLQQTLHITAGKFLMQDADKISGFSSNTVDRLWQSGLFDWIIVEADGAARKPLKACNSNEPVIPGQTTHLILVSGLDALGLPLCDDYVHRAMLFSQNSGLSMGQPIDAFHMAQGLAVEMKKNYQLGPDVFKCIVLNKADNKDMEIKGKSLAEHLVKPELCHGVMIAALESQQPVKKWYLNP